MKSLIKKLLPKQLLAFYHFALAHLAIFWFGRPSHQMLIVGITGTKGKTTTANFIWSVLQNAGIKTGIISTANIRIGEENIPNTLHMTMPGRFFIQKMLRKMVNEKVEVAIVETTSQGIAQFRHVGIAYDVAIFTNLTPEHIESHGSFENYKNAKAKLFEVLSQTKHKKFRGKDFEKTIIANSDSEFGAFYLNFPTDKKYTFSIDTESDLRATEIEVKQEKTCFKALGEIFETKLLGRFNVYNVLPALLVGKMCEVSVAQMKEGVLSLEEIAGRMEEVKNEKGFRVFVDYAHEPAGLEAALKAVNELKAENGKSILVFGAPGGGRDKAKRPLMGEVASKYADIVVVTDDEPYEEDPGLIRKEIVSGMKASKKQEGIDLFIIDKREEGLKKALSIAKLGDVVLCTGMGHQNVRMVGVEAIPWNEKEIVKNLLS